MKTTIRTILCAAIAILPIVSCQKSIDSENPVEPTNPTERGNGTIDICVNGLMGEYTQQDGVKSSLVNNVRVAWAAGDVVYVFDGSKYLGKLTASLDKKADGLTDEDRYAKLGGTISAPATTPCVLSLVHSSLMTEPEAGAAVSELSIDMSAQSTATVPFVAYATLKYTGTTITDVVVPFQFATSVIKVNCTGLWPGTAITSATLDNVNTECKLTLFGDKAPVVAGVTNGTITRTGDTYFAASKVNSEGEAVFQIAVPKLETASSARFLTVSHGSYKFNDRKFTTSSLNPATSVNTVCQLVGPPVGPLPGVFTVSDPDGKPNSGDEKQVYFSKGNLWADASSSPVSLHFEANQYDFNKNYETSHVSHFTWANTVEKAISEKDYDTDHLFCDENHKQSVDGSANIYYALSKDEWNYLLKERTKLNGKNRHYATTTTTSGVIIEGNTYYGLFLYPDDYSGKEVVDNTENWTWDKINSAGIVFLPAAGDRYGDSVSFGTPQPPYPTLSGCYWTSPFYSYEDEGKILFMMYDIDICNDGAGISPRQPYYGNCLRLVTDPQ